MLFMWLSSILKSMWNFVPHVSAYAQFKQFYVLEKQNITRNEQLQFFLFNYKDF